MPNTLDCLSGRFINMRNATGLQQQTVADRIDERGVALFEQVELRWLTGT
jgi:hypothetical protein